MANDDLGELIGKFLEGLGQQRPQQPPPPVQRPAQQRPRPSRGQRSGGRQAGQGGQGAGEQAIRPAGPPRVLPAPPPLDANGVEIVEAEPVTGDDVAEHVQRHLSTSEFTQRAARLGDEVVHAPDDIQQHIADVFGHGPKGRLTGDKPTVATPGDASTTFAPASDFAKLLRSPQDLRMAFIMSEVLRRPEW